jgi:ABC-2 type transport system ATP-binding protein
MIEVQGLTKRYGPTVAVDDLSFQVQPGSVTGFLGPNGSGKSTTMRVILGLDHPTRGAARVKGRRYRSLAAPLREVGAMLDARAVHPGRRVRHHLLALARSNRIPARRVDEVLEVVGLAGAAGRRAGKLSLGMSQRLGIGAALLGDPPVLMLDEPVNGLDTEGIRWIRELLRGFAAEGRTVLLSSHLMSEVELTADRLVVIGRGRLIADTTVEAFVAGGSQPVTRVRSPRAAELRAALEAGGAQVEPDPGGGWRVTGPDSAAVGDLALRHGIGLHELSPLRSSLEDVYTQLTAASVEYRARPRPEGGGDRAPAGGAVAVPHDRPARREEARR